MKQIWAAIYNSYDTIEVSRFCYREHKIDKSQSPNFYVDYIISHSDLKFSTLITWVQKSNTTCNETNEFQKRIITQAAIRKVYNLSTYQPL